MAGRQRSHSHLRDTRRPTARIRPPRCTVMRPTLKSITRQIKMRMTDWQREPATAQSFLGGGTMAEWGPTTHLLHHATRTHTGTASFLSLASRQAAALVIPENPVHHGALHEHGCISNAPSKNVRRPDSPFLSNCGSTTTGPHLGFPEDSRWDAKQAWQAGRASKTVEVKVSCWWCTEQPRDDGRASCQLPVSYPAAPSKGVRSGVSTNYQ